MLFSFTPILWFVGRNGILINGSDTNFPLDPVVWFLRRLYVWNNVANAGANFSSSISGFFFHAIQVVGFLITRNLQTTQIISLIFWFSMIIFSAWIFIRNILPKNLFAQLVFVCLYAFNTYLFNTWENVKVANLALVVALPLVLTLWLVTYQKTISFGKSVFYSSLVGILMSGSGINPAYFATVFFGLAILIFVKTITKLSRKNIKQVIVSTAMVVLPLIGVNLFWILPTVKNLFFSDAAVRNLTDIGYTNWLDSLSQNTNFFNVLRIQGAWDWYAFNDAGAPLYIPYVNNYFKNPPFILFSALIPLIAFLSLVFRMNKDHAIKDLYPFFGSLVILGVFLSVGSHAPTGVIYNFLVRHLPFFSFFRSPWYIFTPLLILSISALVALFLELCRHKYPRFVLVVLATIIVVGNLVYCYPLATGRIFRPSFPDNFYVKFPDYLFQAQGWLKTTKNQRIIGYPDDEIERFTWGYNGIESILNLFSEKETLFASLSNADSPIGVLIKQFYSGLRRGEIEKVYNLAGKLNVGVMFIKNDQISLAPKVTDIVKMLGSSSFGLWTFYSLPESYQLPKLYTADKIWLTQKAQDGSEKLPLIEGRGTLLNFGDSVVKVISDLLEKSGEIVLAKNSQYESYSRFINSPSIISNRISHRDLSVVDFSFNLSSDDVYYPVIERYGLAEFGLDVVDELTVGLDQTAVVLSVDRKDSSYIYFKGVDLLAGDHRLQLNLSVENLLEGGDFEKTLSMSSSEKTEIKIETENGNKYLSFLNRDENKVTVDLIPKYFDPNIPYLLELRYKQIYGDNASISLEQGNSQTLVKAQAEGMPSLPEWLFYSVYFDPVKTMSNLKVCLLAPAKKDSLGTKILYDDIAFYRVFTNKLFLVKKAPKLSENTPAVSFKRISPVKYEANVAEAVDPHILIFSENFSKDWKIKLFSNLGHEIPFEPLHFSANMYANAWYFDEILSEYKAVIYYQPQKYLVMGSILSVATLIGAGFMFWWLKNKQK